MGVRARTRLTILLAALGAVGGAAAQAPAGGRLGAPPTPTPRMLRALDVFLANPEGLLSRYPNGGGALAAQIRDILIADKTQLEAVFKLLPTATAAQQEAIGSGLGLVRLLFIRDSDFTNSIQTRVVALDNRNVLVGYALFGGSGVAAVPGPASPAPSTPAVTFGPVGPVAGAPSAYSQGRKAGGGDGGDGLGLGGGTGGLGSGGTLTSTGPLTNASSATSARTTLGATAASPSGAP